MPNSQAKRPPPFILPRFATIFIAGMLLAICLLLLFPQTMAFEAIVNWLLIIAVVRLLVKALWRDHRRYRFGPARRHTVRLRHDKSRNAPSHAPARSSSKDWLGPFNPDDGLPLDESPYRARQEPSSVTPTTFSDGEPWD